jgi:hypothetical protein
MANKNFEAVQAPESEVKLITGHFVGVNGSAVTEVGGCVASVTRQNEGDWDVVLTDRHRYPSGSKLFHSVTVVNAAGAHAEPSAYDEDAGTLTVSGWTAAGAADDCDTMRIEILIVVRNSTSRRAT